MRQNFELMRLLALSIVLLGCGFATATPPKFQLSKTEAETIARDLIDSISESYECITMFDSLLSRPDSAAIQFTVMVTLRGDDCRIALQDLRHRSEIFQLNFAEIRSLEIPDDSDPDPIMDLIREVDPEVGR